MEGMIKLRDLTQFDTAELNADRLAGLEEIKICKKALAAGVVYYDSYDGKKKIGERLSINTVILRAIDKELFRRQND